MHLASLLALLLVPAAPAHQDRLLEVAPDGVVTGAPRRYGRIRIADDPPSVSIGAKTVTLPACLAGHFRPHARGGMQVSASWYHERAKLPPYLSVFFPAEAGAVVHGDSFLFDLETAALLAVRVATPAGRQVPLDPEAVCSAAELRQLVPTTAR